MPSIAWDLVDGRLVVLVHGAPKQDPAEWTAYVAWLQAEVSHEAGFLVITPGSGPSSTQRQELVSCFDGRGRTYRRAAVPTDSAIARGIVTALSWFDADLRVFGPRAFDDALAYLEIPEGTHAAAHATARRLARGRLRGAPRGLTGAREGLWIALGADGNPRAAAPRARVRPR